MKKDNPAVENITTPQYFYEKGLRRFKLQKVYDYDARACYFRIAYDICTERSEYPDFFCDMCITLADDQFRNGYTVKNLRTAIRILETALGKCQDPTLKEKISERLDSYRENLKYKITDNVGIGDQFRPYFNGIEKLDEFWGKDFSFHDCWIKNFIYDRMAATITLDLVDPNADYDNPKQFATLRFNSIVEFDFNTETHNDYLWRLSTKLTQNGYYLVVELNGAHLEITCHDVDVISITK